MATTYNTTLSNLFNAAFGTASLDDAVFSSTHAVERGEAMLALVAGYLAARDAVSHAVACRDRDVYLDRAAALLSRSKPGSKSGEARTKDEQSIYMRAVAKYGYYFNDGATSKGAKAAKAKSVSFSVKAATVEAFAAKAKGEFTKAELRKLAALLLA